MSPDDRSAGVLSLGFVLKQAGNLLLVKSQDLSLKVPEVYLETVEQPRREGEPKVRDLLEDRGKVLDFHLMEDPD